MDSRKTCTGLGLQGGSSPLPSLLDTPWPQVSQGSPQNCGPFPAVGGAAMVSCGVRGQQPLGPSPLPCLLWPPPRIRLALEAAAVVPTVPTRLGQARQVRIWSGEGMWTLALATGGSTGT